MGKAKTTPANKSPEEMQAELEIANEVIKEQAEALKSAKVEKEHKTPTVKIGGKTYKLTIPRFEFEGEVKTISSFSEEESLGEMLLNIGFGGLEEI
jgi:hypothetical protein